MNNRSVFVKGDKIDLVCLGRDDAETVHRWSTDMDVVFYWGNQPFPADLKSIQERLENQHGRKNSLNVGIQLSGTDNLIGMGGLCHIDWPWRRAELSMCIGEKECQGKGYGKEASMLVLEHAFVKLNLHSILLRVCAYNTNAIKCYESCGFKHAGVRRESRLDGDKFHDSLYMDLLAPEFKDLAGAAE